MRVGRNIPMRVDKFIIYHTDNLDGRLRLHFAENEVFSLEQERKMLRNTNK